MSEQGNPYTQSDYEQLLRAEKALDAVDALIVKGRKCEVNCDVADAISQEMRRKLAALRNEFFTAPSTLPYS
jgi:hypothetical protein